MTFVAVGVDSGETGNVVVVVVLCAMLMVVLELMANDLQLVESDDKMEGEKQKEEEQYAEPY